MPAQDQASRNEASPHELAEEQQTHRVLVVQNPIAGQSSPEFVRQIICAAFEAAGWQCDVYETTGHDDFPALIEQARRDGDDLVVAVGGDGTVADVADALVGAKIPLGIVPLGTGNVLAAELGISEDPRQAVALLVGEHHVCQLDAMQVAGHHYFLQVGTGLGSLMIRDTSREAKRRFGRLAYMVTLIRGLFGYRLRRYTLLIDGRVRRVRAWDVLVANAGTLGMRPLQWSPEINPTDGRLDVVVVKIRSLRDWSKVLWRLLLGLPHSGPAIRVYPLRHQATIASRRPQPVQADGEMIGTTPFAVRLVPRAIAVIVPVECPATEPASAAEGRERALRLQQRLRPWLGPIGLIDTSVALLLNALPHPPILNLIARGLAVVMNRGDGWLIPSLLDLLVHPRRGWRSVLAIAPALWLTDAIVELGLKRAFRRDRPFQAQVLAPVIGPKPGSHSFPSGRAAAAFAGAWLVSRRYPRLADPAYTFAATVAFSRLYLGVHYFRDVVIGAVSGVGLAAGFSFITRKALKLVGLR
jgi:diacylglycerol kinase family enzyme/membrane-associated phospholipid phosphatase